MRQTEFPAYFVPTQADVAVTSKVKFYYVIISLKKLFRESFDKAK